MKQTKILYSLNLRHFLYTCTLLNPTLFVHHLYMSAHFSTPTQGSNTRQLGEGGPHPMLTVWSVLCPFSLFSQTVMMMAVEMQCRKIKSDIPVISKHNRKTFPSVIEAPRVQLLGVFLVLTSTETWRTTRVWVPLPCWSVRSVLNPTMAHVLLGLSLAHRVHPRGPDHAEALSRNLRLMRNASYS